MSKVDEAFFKRADDYINVANEHLSDVSRGKVNASMMYGVSRFSAWISACEFDSATGMKNSKEEIKKYFVGEFEKMLNENLDDYITNFDGYMKKNG